MEWKSDLFAEYFAAVADRGGLWPLHFLLILKTGGLQRTHPYPSPPLPPFAFYIRAYSLSLYPPPGKDVSEYTTRVMVVVGGKTNDYSTHETHAKHCMTTAATQFDGAGEDHCAAT